MKNLLGKRVILDGDNDCYYAGEGRIVGYDKGGVIIEIASLVGWDIMEDDEIYIDNYEIPEGCSLMWTMACDCKFTPTIDTLEAGDHFWGKLDNKIAVFIYNGYDAYPCGNWENGIEMKYITFVCKVDIPKGYGNKDLWAMQ